MGRLEQRKVFALERIADALEELVEEIVTADKPNMIVTGEAPRPPQAVREKARESTQTPAEEAGIDPMGDDES